MAWGYTFETAMNAALDRISVLEKSRSDAIGRLLVFQREHPEFADDPVLQEIHFNLL